MFSTCLRTSSLAIRPTAGSFIPRLQLTAKRPFSATSRIMSDPIAAGTLDPKAPGEQYEPRQTATSDDYTPDPSKSIKLSPARQSLVDDVIALYSCEPTIKRVERYTADCVYDDQFVYANDRYKMAGQWFALPKLFKDSKNERYEVVVNEPGLIQFRNEQVRPDFLHNRRSLPLMFLLFVVLDVQAHTKDCHYQCPGLAFT